MSHYAEEIIKTIKYYVGNDVTISYVPDRYHMIKFTLGFHGERSHLDCELYFSIYDIEVTIRRGLLNHNLIPQQETNNE